MKTIAVIPAYNAEETIAKVVDGTKKFVDKVLVVDDGSIDTTGEEAKKKGAEVIKLDKNTGKANATRVGFTKCGGYDVVITMDADFQHLPEEIPRFIEGIEKGMDLCIGSRFLNRNYEMSLKRRFSNSVVRTVINFLIKQKLTDPQSGFRALRRNRVKELELRGERYAIEHIMILEAARKKFKIGEVPISCVYRGERSHIRPVRDTLRVVYYISKFVLGLKG